MSAYLIRFKLWITAQGGWAHVGAAIIAFLTLSFNTVTPFHALCLLIWSDIPSVLASILASIAGMYILYMTSHHITSMRMMAKKLTLANSEVLEARATVNKVYAEQARAKLLNPVQPLASKPKGT